MPHLVAAVSPERIAAELRAMLSRSGRRQALDLLLDTGLAREVVPDLAPPAVAERQWREAAQIVDAFDEPDLPMALATLAEDAGDEVLPRMHARLRLSNREAKKGEWLRAGVAAVASGADPAGRPWSEMQRWVAHEDAAALADVLRARAACGLGDAGRASWFSGQVVRPRAEIDPPPLVTGNDLLAAGVPPGKAVGAALARVRALQLDGAIATKGEAIAAALNGA
jgi:tRNA nucleotidyltransferase/poly(A) polymerase